MTDAEELELIEDDMRQLRRSCDDFYWTIPEYRAMARGAAKLRKKLDQENVTQT